jgi:hypothetical protein
MRLTLGAGAVVAAALTPAAYAVDAGPAGISVTPGSPAPGTDVQVRAMGCGGRTGTAASDAFVSDARLTGGGGAGLIGETRVRTTLAPGSYGIEVDCDGHAGRVKGTVTVTAPHDSAPHDSAPHDSAPHDTSAQDSAPHDSAPHDSAPGDPAPQESAPHDSAPHDSAPYDSAPSVSAPASPVAPVHAGGGGAARLAAADARAAGPGTRQAVIGLVLAGVAAIAVAVRSARRGHDRRD